MQTVTIKKAIAFKTNEYSETPEVVKIEFTPETLHRIATIQSLVKQYDLFSAKIEVMDKFTLLDADGNESQEWFTREGTFIIYIDSFYFYAQSKWDSSDQIESEQITCEEIWLLFPVKSSIVNP